MERWIVHDPDTRSGNLRARGARLSVAFLIALVARRAPREQILPYDQSLPLDGLDAASPYVAASLRDDVVWDTRSGTDRVRPLNHPR